MRGRVISLIQLNPALIAAGSFISGPLGDGLGARGAVAVSASACAIVVIALLVRSARFRELRLSRYRNA
jgi:hypothetical protein